MRLSVNVVVVFTVLVQMEEMRRARIQNEGKNVNNDKQQENRIDFFAHCYT